MFDVVKVLRVVGAAGGVATFACPICVEELATGFVEALVGMGAKIIPLGLKQVRRQPCAPIPIKKG